ncbi:hypothetical protein [Alkalicoccus halolimnae]|uniref:DUF2273 domain-containing protein n=1 Tax=Alkalicoccus halolimnae TaxID=1667239 RepID=A0A5C7FI08_9BACI|nr:hypothetical protein [Alkalicoccus halolimnae]TXF85924.1 hypothetical protein FTX54_07560 [Alkalicoccus halolimnae]
MNIRGVLLVLFVGVGLVAGFSLNNFLVWMVVGAGAGWLLDNFLSSLRTEEEQVPSELEKRLAAYEEEQQAAAERKEKAM